MQPATHIRMRATNSTPLPATTAGPTDRLAALPTYVFAWLDELKAAARARGAELIDLGIGNPDQPTPPSIVAAITRAYADPHTHGYPPFRGTQRFLDSAAGFMQRRFGVAVDPQRDVVAVSGGKEGIAHLVMAFTDEDSVALVPDIHYPVHSRVASLVGGQVHLLPLRRESGFLPDLKAIPESVARKARLLIVNYPHNPTGAIASLGFYKEAVAFCARHDIVLVSDLAYSEIAFDGFVAPSVLEVPDAMSVAVEFHSLSKTFNMAGSRIGFAVGNADVIEALYAVRTNMGYGTPAAIQDGAAYALDHAEQFAAPARHRYQERRDVVLDGFRSLGWNASASPATMFVWLEVPRGFDSQGWSEYLIRQAGVVVTPGNAFGPGGEGFFRVSLVAPPNVIGEAITRLRTAGVRFSGA